MYVPIVVSIAIESREVLLIIIIKTIIMIY